MDRIQYNKCMSPLMKGEGKTKEERQNGMCIGAKLCTGKAKTQEEAATICSQPRPPKPVKVGGKKRKGKSCEKDVFKIVECMIPKIDMKAAENINSIGQTIAIAMAECMCGGKDAKD